MKNNITSPDSDRHALLFPPGGIFWIWVLLWVTGGTIVGGMTSKSLYLSIIYGDYGGGAWIGGIAFFLMLCGGFSGMIQGISAYKYKDSLWIVFFRIIGGSFLSSTGSFSSFIMIVILMRALFIHVNKYIARTSMPTFVIISGLLIGGAAGAVLGILQGFLQEMLTWIKEQRKKHLLVENHIMTTSQSMTEHPSGERRSEIFREEDRIKNKRK